MDGWIYIILAILAILVIIVIMINIILPSNKDDVDNASNLMDPIEVNTFPFKTYVINLDRKPERYQYITNQLNKLGIKNYERWSATDGFKVTDEEMMKVGATKELINKGRGLAGCASSHLRLWKYLVETNADYTLILEDDAHFHPQFIELFKEYWKKVPKDAKIIFPGWCSDCGNNTNPIIDTSVMCLQGYILSSKMAEYLLKNLPPMTMPIDVVIVEYFRYRSGSIIFNGNTIINNIRPDDYKDKNERKCMFNGIIYQNHQEQGSTIKQIDTVY